MSLESMGVILSNLSVSLIIHDESILRRNKQQSTVVLAIYLLDVLQEYASGAKPLRVPASHYFFPLSSRSLMNDASKDGVTEVFHG